MLNPSNYINKSCQVDFSALPITLAKGHDLALSAFKDQQAAYKSNSTIKAVMDHYLIELNKAVEKEQPVKRTSNKKAKKRSATLRAVIGEVPSISEEVRFIRRFLWLDGKTREKQGIERLLFALQKAMIERRIRKNSPYAKEIQKIHDHLWSIATNDNIVQVRIDLDPKLRAQYEKIAKSQSVKDAVRILKRFIPLQGKSDIDKKVVNLQKQAKALLESGKLLKNSSYHIQVTQMLEELNNYMKYMESDSPVLALNPQELGKLPEVMSSQQLLSMEFETIDIQGRWKELIGDPSIGFSMMVYGQPKSGKSTLMMEFAQYLAQNHGNTLYVAIEEGFGYTLKDKIQRVGAKSTNLSFAADMPSSLEGQNFVFIDSISRGEMELEDLIKLQEKYPKIGFIYIFHTTKDGRFRGGNHYAHEVDVIVEVSPEEIKSSGRFGPAVSIKR